MDLVGVYTGGGGDEGGGGEVKAAGAGGEVEGRVRLGEFRMWKGSILGGWEVV